MHFDQLRTVQLDADALANDLSWEDEIVKNAIVDSSQGAATWALLLVWVGASALRLGQDLAFGTENDMTSGELLLQLTNQASLDLLESLLLGDWNVNDDGLKQDNQTVSRVTGTEISETYLLAAEFNLTGTSNVKLAHRLLELAVHFELQEGLADLLLEVAGLSASAFNNLGYDHLKRKINLMPFITSKFPKLQ